MFWNCAHMSSPQIDTVFHKEDLTLQELLEQENILQELKSQNKKLIDFLTRPDVLSELVTLITTEPSADIPEKDRYKHPNIACELLTTDIPSLNERLARDDAVLSKLYSFLEAEPPLNPLLASFFSRTMGVLIVRKGEQNWYSYQFTCLQVLEFLKSKGSCISLLLKHLGTSAIMDLALKLVTQVEGNEVKENILNWMSTQGLVESLVDLLQPSVCSHLHCNASLLLCDIISEARKAQLNCTNKTKHDPILSTLESPETVKKILEVILKGEKCESSLVGGISVLLTLLEPPEIVSASIDSGGCVTFTPSTATTGEQIAASSGGAGDSPEQPQQLPVILSTTEAIIPYLPDLHDLLLNPPHKSPIKMTCGVVDPPLGNTRLHVIKLIAALISTHNPKVNKQLSELGTIQVMLDLFFRYTWNNFLHTQVEKCLALALNAELTPSQETGDNTLLLNIFVKCRLLQRILTAWKENEVEQSEKGGCRRGYMGHLTRIANTIAKQADSSSLGEFLSKNVPEDELSEWGEFVKTTLESINKTHEHCLGGNHPSRSRPENDDKDFKDVSFTQDTVLPQICADYQMQEMAPQFIDNFGYHEAEFNDTEDSLPPSVDRLMNLSFNLTDDDELERQAEMFNQVCSQKQLNLDVDDDEEEEVWAENHTVPSRIWNGGEEGANYNSSDDEERPGPEGREEAHMEVDPSDPWLTPVTAAAAAAVVPVAVDVVANPWGDSENNESENAANSGWADFDTNFGAATIAQFESVVGMTDSEPQSSSGTVLPTSTPLPDTSHTSSTSIESREEPTGADSSTPQCTNSESRCEITHSPKSDEPASSQDCQNLIDNYRFLSKQGLLQEENVVVVDKKTSEESKVQSSDDTNKGEKQKEPLTEPSTKTVPTDPV